GRSRGGSAAGPPLRRRRPRETSTGVRASKADAGTSCSALLLLGGRLELERARARLRDVARVVSDHGLLRRQRLALGEELQRGAVELDRHPPALAGRDRE